MRRILVTGANKGIGLAIVQAILDEHEDTYVYLGARDAARGRAAAASLVERKPALRARVEVVPLDVRDEASIAAAVAQIEQSAGGDKLYGLVNNAGVGNAPLADVLETNAVAIHRVSEALVPLLDATRGRIVNVTSAAGPSFVATCSPEMQRFFLDASTPWSGIEAFVRECIAMDDDKAAFAAKGLGDGAAYGLSKAVANKITLLLARAHPNLCINACTPGFIETDMTRHFVESERKSPAELGMKPPAAGARAPMHLLFGEVEGSGRYYGSDAQRSPLDRYRAPGTAPHTG